MRRRERWRNISWLEWMADDTRAGEVNMDVGAPLPVGEAINQLLKSYGRYVEMEQLGDGFRVRLLPQSPWEEVGPLNFGMAYAGTNLPRMLTTAVVECDMIASGEVGFRQAAKETWRRVR